MVTGSVVGIKYRDGVMLACDTTVHFGIGMLYDNNVSRYQCLGKDILMGDLELFSIFRRV